MKKLNDFILIVLCISLVVLTMGLLAEKMLEKELESGYFTGIIIFFISSVIYSSSEKKRDLES